MTNLDPNDFIIIRKRKKYKFALFANSPLCFELDEWQPRDVDVVEVGAGTGLFSVELATRHPDRQYTAVDVKADRLQKGATVAEERKLKNIHFIRARADQLDQIVPKDSVTAIWLTFSDPFPKKRATGRRMTHPHYLQLYKDLLAKDGSFYLKHDNRDFFHWSLEQLINDGWHIDELSFDLHGSDLADDYKILTTYEQRWLDDGLTTNFVKASRQAA